MNVNEQLLKAIQARGQKQEPFAYGILTADRYVRTMEERVGPDVCDRTMQRFTRGSFADALTKAASTLTYTNPDMKLGNVEYERTVGDVKELDSGIELPKNTLMAFRHTLTTPKKDRDGDILRTEGAEVDPSMLLLWQHVHTLPIGKVLSVAEHTKDRLNLVSAIVDVNELAHDAAVMINNKMGRFSHGFRALEYEELKGEDGEPEDPDNPFGGFDVKRFEIMEASLVSVPSNVDAETEEVLLSLVEDGKLTSSVMKEVGKSIRGKKPLMLPVKLELTDDSKQMLKEIEDANKSRGGEEEAGGKSDDGSSKEADAEDGTKDEKAEARLSEGFELTEVQKQAIKRAMESGFSRNDIKRYVGKTGVTGDHDHPVVLDDEGNGVAQQAEGHVHKIAEFKVETTDGHSHPLDKGELEERSFEYFFKKSGEEKRGRSLSKANEAKIRDAKETIDEVLKMDLQKLVKAALREASANLDVVLGALGMEEQEASAEAITVEKAAEVILTCATKTQKENLWQVLGSEERSEKNKQRTEQYRAIVGSKQ